MAWGQRPTDDAQPLLHDPEAPRHGTPAAASSGSAAAVSPHASEWKVGIKQEGKVSVEGSGAQPTGSPPPSAPPADPAEISKAAEDTAFAVDGEVLVGVPTELKLFPENSSYHWRTGVITLLFWAALIFFLVELAIHPSQSSPNCYDNDVNPNNDVNPSNDDNNVRYSYCPDTPNNDDGFGDGGPAYSLGIPLLGVMALINIVESCCSETRRYVGSIESVGGAEAFLNRLVDTAPTLSMSCRCWHQEMRTRVITSTDSYGNTTTRYETYYVDVTTYRETAYFEYDGWRDGSGPFHGLSLYNIVKLKVYKALIWADQASRDTFFAAFSAFNARNRWRDVHYSSSWGMNLAGYKKNILSVADPKPWWLSFQCFCLWSLLGASWCFRRLLTTSSVDAEFTVKKVIRA